MLLSNKKFKYITYYHTLTISAAQKKKKNAFMILVVNCSVKREREGDFRFCFKKEINLKYLLGWALLGWALVLGLLLSPWFS